MMKAAFIIIFIFSLIGVTSCEKLTKTIWVYYNETKCEIPWGTEYVDDDETRKNVKKYLKNHHINVFEVKVLNEAPSPCDACHCKSGKVIKSKIKEDDLQKAKELGFYL